LLHENSTLGELLKALFGYNGNPSLTELIAYAAYFVLLWLGIQRFVRPIPLKQPLKN
jgi:high-affinity iron transporter